MIKNIKERYLKLDLKAFKILKFGLLLCLFISILSMAILFTYLLLSYPFLYLLGMFFFRISLIFSVEFVLCAFVADYIKKELIS